MKLILVLLALVVIASCAPLSEKQYKFLFEKYQENFNKKYTADEVAFRFANFKHHLDAVRAHNARTDVSFTTAMNHLCDLSRDEYLALVPSLGTPPEPVGEIWTNTDYPKGDGLGDGWDIDWNAAGAVTDIKDQGQCGSCWAFSTTGTMEGRHKITSGELVSLSESELVDCDQTCYGCNGCWPATALNWEVKNGGLCTESSYDYHPVQEGCRKGQCTSKVDCQGPVSVQSGSESALASAVANNGPVSVAIDAGHESFQRYSSGVYYEPNCSSTELDHAVLCCGYGTQDGTPAWLVKNSWGVSWGQKGWIWMSKDKDNNCGIATTAMYPSSC
jgi:cathepsin L